MSDDHSSLNAGPWFSTAATCNKIWALVIRTITHSTITVLLRYLIWWQSEVNRYCKAVVFFNILSGDCLLGLCLMATPMWNNFTISCTLWRSAWNRELTSIWCSAIRHHSNVSWTFANMFFYSRPHSMTFDDLWLWHGAEGLWCLTVLWRTNMFLSRIFVSI